MFLQLIQSSQSSLYRGLLHSDRSVPFFWAVFVGGKQNLIEWIGDYATFSDATFGSLSDATQNSFQSFRQKREMTSCALGTELLIRMVHVLVHGCFTSVYLLPQKPILAQEDFHLVCFNFFFSA